MSKLLTDTGVLFHHIPRTGGHWVDWALVELDLPVNNWSRRIPQGWPRRHGLLSQYAYSYRVLIKKIFTFVRHPLAYYSSAWRLISEDTDYSRFRWHPHAGAARLWSPNFDKWVERMLEEQPLWLTRIYEMYVGPVGGEFCHWIGRTEHLEHDLRWILEDIGYRVKRRWDRVQGSPPKKASSPAPTWDRGLRQQVLQMEQEVIQRFYQSTGPRCRGLVPDPVSAAKNSGK